MSHFICSTCGTQHPESEEPPSACRICTDERQYVGWDGQEWTTLDDLRESHTSAIDSMEPGLTRIGMRPLFGIGQHAFLVQSPGGNVLWDCTSLIDEDIMAAVEGLGGLAAIAISHPHYYSSMLEWSRAFGGVSVLLHQADRAWVSRPGPEIDYWSGDHLALHDGLTLIRGGGHFEGGTMLHWPAGADGAGVLLPGDIISVVHDRRWVTFMYSFPNYIPLPASEARRVAGTIEPYDFDRIYSPFLGRVVVDDAKNAVKRSAERYVRALEG